MVGLWHAATFGAQHCALPVMHLHTLNPYVLSALESAPAAAWHAARQAGGRPASLPTGDAATSCCGTSAFAYQGTNAHVLLRGPGSSAEAAGLLHVVAAVATPLQEERLWVALRVTSILQVVVAQLATTPATTVLFESCVTGHRRLEFLRDHQVHGQAIVPGSALLEMAVSAAMLTLLPGRGASNGGVAVADAAILSPVILPRAKAAALGEPPQPDTGDTGVCLHCSLDLQTGRIEVQSSPSGPGRRSRLHLTATATALLASPPPPAPGAAATATAATPTARWLGAVWRAAVLPAGTAATAWLGGARWGGHAHACSVAHLACPADVSSFLQHPALLDCSFQLGAARLDSLVSTLMVPAAARCVSLQATPDTSQPEMAEGAGKGYRCVVRPTAPPAPGGPGPAAAASRQSSTMDVWLLDAAQGCATGCRVAGLLAKPMRTAAPPAPPADAASTTAVASRVSVEGDELDGQLLYVVAHRVSRPVGPAPRPSAHMMGTPSFTLSPGGRGVASFSTLLSLMQKWGPAELLGVQGAQLVLPIPRSASGAGGGGGVAETGAGGWAGPALLQGLLKASALELPGLRISCSQHLLNEGSSKSGWRAELLRHQKEQGGLAGRCEAALSSAGCELEEVLLPSLTTPAQGDFQLVPGRVASLSGLEPRALQVADLAPGQMAVRVRAVGVNFRDLLNVLGMYPGDPGLPGGDCAGVVVASRVHGGPRPGEAVFGLAVGSLGTMVHCSPDTLVAMPACLSFEEAASMPTVFITAQQVFRSATDVQAGESVLVHAAAGGVGLASLQVLRAMQARVVATAGSPSKRALLRQLGVEDVAGSRGTAFVEAAAQLGGVDVVLNTLTSPGMIAATASVLRLGGRFVEISKRDIWSPARLQQERPDMQYSFVAVDFLPNSSVHAALSQVCAGVCRGQLRPLPTASHGLGAVAAAMRQMSQARHVGKVVISSPPLSPLSAPHGRVIITGGMGTLGLLLADWLCSRSAAACVTLLGRSGRPRTGSGSQPDHALLAKLLSSDCPTEVTLQQCDMGQAEDTAAAFGGHRAPPAASSLGPGAPLLAVLHAGGVLADGMLQNQSPRSALSVFAPKLAQLSRWTTLASQQPACASVLFSSLSSLLGSPGQANYSAANAALDATAQAMAQRGSPVLAVQWGAWAGGGMASQYKQTAARLERLGMALIQPLDGLRALEGLLGVAAAAGRLQGLGYRCVLWLCTTLTAAYECRPLHANVYGDTAHGIQM